MTKVYDGNNLYFTSDTHFGHRSMAVHWRMGKYPWRGATLDELLDPAYKPWDFRDWMDHHLIEQWNAVVPKRGIVFHLGDVTFRNAKETREILERLNGEVHVVPGNHDKKQINVLRDFGWIIEPQYLEIDVGEQRIVMCHYAFRSWNRMHYGAWNLHGHSHGNLEANAGKQLDVGVDCDLVASEMRPLSFEEISRYMAGVEFVSVDHHTPKEEK